MNEEELLETLRQFEEKRVEQLNENARALFYAIMKIADERDYLKIKYNKALELLVDFNLPCEKDDFNLLYSDYCEKHCGVDEEQFKKCWDKFIEWKLNKEE